MLKNVACSLLVTVVNFSELFGIQFCISFFRSILIINPCFFFRRESFLQGKDHIRPDFPGTVPDLWILQISVPVSRQVQFGKPNAPVFSKSSNTFLTKHINMFTPDLTTGNTGSKACARWQC